jgi:glyoxylate/hydroxypyruvate reductase A
MSAERPHIFFSSTLDSPQVWRAALARHLDDFEFTVGPECDRPDEVDVVLVHKVPPGGLLRFPRLRAILSLSAGINQFDPAQLPAGVPLSRSIDSSLTRHMVLYAKTAVLRYHRRFDVFERNKRDAIWKFEAPLLPAQTCVGILGLGELGSAIARDLAADGFEVQGWSKSPKDLPGVSVHVGQEHLRAMLGAADIVINVLPLTQESRSILCLGLFRHFKKGARLINMGRGDHLVEPDLLQALEEGLLGGATLDVTSVEPLPGEHPLWAHPGVLITPHVAGLTTPETAAPQIADNVRRAMLGERLVNQVDWQRGY